ncbi:Mif2/CENP-C like-domain-containing protein [Endogone sp. FLAS-F59071]|nr:Mif2/CENP-C like-domain-containing protein [Endogone sp. FLAS-F59071]|eukprot:RUS14235.1 Mif2/CENP-C like-domain-containing protein [Endogone sp. FLAS-F59071]
MPDGCIYWKKKKFGCDVTHRKASDHPRKSSAPLFVPSSFSFLLLLPLLLRKAFSNIQGSIDRVGHKFRQLENPGNCLFVNKIHPFMSRSRNQNNNSMGADRTKNVDRNQFTSEIGVRGRYTLFPDHPKLITGPPFLSKTGVTVKSNVRKDEDGLDNISDFFGDESTVHPGDADDSLADNNDGILPIGQVLPDNVNGEVISTSRPLQRSLQDELIAAAAAGKENDFASPTRPTPFALRSDETLPYDDFHTPSDHGSTSPELSAARRRLFLPNGDGAIAEDDTHEEDENAEIGAMAAKLTTVRKLKKKDLTMLRTRGGAKGATERGGREIEEEAEEEDKSEDEGEDEGEDDEEFNLGKSADRTPIRIAGRGRGRGGKRGRGRGRRRGRGRGAKDAGMEGRERVESATTKVRQVEQTVEDDDDEEEHLVMNRQSKMNNTVKVQITKKLSSKKPTPMPVKARRGRPPAAKIPSSEAEEEDFEEKDEEEEMAQEENGEMNEHGDAEEEKALEKHSKEKPNGKVKSVDLGKAKVVPTEERKTRLTKLAEEDEVENGEQMQERPKGKGARRTGAVKKTIVDVKNQADADGQEEDEKVRRSRRTKIAPLKFWAGEKVLYGMGKSGQAVFPVITKIIRVPSDDEGAGIKRRRRATDNEEDGDEDDDEDDEDHTKKRRKAKTGKMQEILPPEGVVVQYPTGQEIRRRIAVSAEMIKTTAVSNQTYMFQKVFSEGDFMSSGVVVLPKGAEKPNKNSRGSAMVFHVIIGSVHVTIHKTHFTISTGGQFIVPRGNQYRIVNVANRESRLFFAQAREVQVPLVTDTASVLVSPTGAHESSREAAEEKA